MPKGYKHTPEARAKMSIARKGNQNALGHKHTPEWRAKLSAANKGKHPSPETKAKISAALKGSRNPMWGRKGSKHPMWGRKGSKNPGWGSRRTPETRAKMSASASGPNSSQWLGGISREPYSWNFDEELKERIRCRDNHQCQLCGIPQIECDMVLNVHHISYNKQDSDPVNLVSLCRSCHSRTNAHRYHWEVVFKEQAIERSIAEMPKSGDVV